MRTAHVARSRANRRARSRVSSRGDPGEQGFTIVELLVTLLVVAIVLPLAFGLIRNLLQQSQNVGDTIAGVQQDQTAGEALLQYLHGTTVILPGSNATTLDASILAGVGSTATPYTATLQASLTNSASPNGDATFTTTLTPQGGTGHSIGTYYAVNSSSVFTYYYNDSTSTTTSTSTSTSTSLPAGLAATSTPTNAQLSEIVAVGVSVTFLAGPHVPTEGYQAVHPTTFQTTIYLQNATGAPAPTSSTVVKFTGGNQVGSSITATATVSPVPDGGGISFSVELSGSAVSVCTSQVPVSTTTGTATCTFTPSTVGTYDFTASFSGTGHFQPSASGATPLVILAGAASTTTSVAATASRVAGQNYDSISMTATISPVPDGGSVTFTITQVGCASCTWTSSGQVPLSGPKAGIVTSNLTNFKRSKTFSITAAYSGDANYNPSTATTSVATP